MRDLERRGVSQSVIIYTIDITGLIRMSYKWQELITFESICVHPRCLVLPMPDLPLCLGVLKHSAPLARGGPSSCQIGFLHVCPNIT